MDPVRRCVLYYFLFGQLIAGVNHDGETFAYVQNVLSKHNNYPATKAHDFISRLPHVMRLNSNDVDGDARLESSNLSTLGPMCLPFDSCNSRCGDETFGLPYTCNCDQKCILYSDCCTDYLRECGNVSYPLRNVLSDNISRISVTCQMMFDSYPVLMVSNCSRWYKSTRLADLCNTDLPSHCFLPSMFADSDSSDVISSCTNFVYSLCSEDLNSKCNQSIEPSCTKLIQRQCRKMAASKCKTCEKSFWPVVDLNGLLYKNSYCAMCNFQTNITIPEFQKLVTNIHTPNTNFSYNSSKIFRSCFPSTIDCCKENTDLSALCRSTSGPVTLTTKYPYYDAVFKNVYCALCNNETIDDLECVTLWSNSSEEFGLMQGAIKPLIMDFVTGVTADIQGLRLDDIPAAFSLLLNFGLDGRQRVYISSEGDEALKQHQKNCKPGLIWDPFSSICRRLHCSTEFVLVDYQCVRKEIQEDYNSTIEDNIQIPDTETDYVHLSFMAEMELLDFLQFYKLDIDVICESIRESFSSSFNINIDRLRNVKFNISFGNFDSYYDMVEFINVMEDNHPINFSISLDLYESSVNTAEPSVDSIVSLLASALSVNGFELGINNATSRIYEIHQTVDYLTSWCDSKDGGERKEYWNSEFRLILNENVTSNAVDKIKGIYIKETEKFYPKGEFVADILYQGYQFNQNLINVSGLAIVCDRKKKLNDSCPRLILEKNEYNISENGTLILLNTSLRGIAVDDQIYEEAGNESIMVCLISDKFKYSDYEHSIKMDVAQAYVSFYLSWISVLAMIIVFITYSLFPSLRNLPGCNTMNLTFSLTVMQITFLFGQRNTVTGKSCKFVACFLHYVIITCFMWMNVMAYDLYKTFGNKTMMNNIRSTAKYLPRYMVYSYGIPALLITATSMLDHFFKDSDFSPHYGRNDICWITNKYAAATYFAIPLALIMLVNLCFFVLTIRSIRDVKHVLYLANEKTKQRGRSDVLLYARMALVIGLTWALAFSAAYTNEDQVTGKILTYLFIIFNTLQGVFIFCVFVCNRRVFGLYRGAIQKLLSRISKSTISGKSKVTLTRLANVMHRTISTDTVISTISTSSTNSSESDLDTIKEVK